MGAGRGGHRGADRKGSGTAGSRKAACGLVRRRRFLLVIGHVTATSPIDGSRDIAFATADLAVRLPEPLAPLARLAFNYRWSWLPGAPELFEALDPERFALCGQNPVRMLQELPGRRLAALAQDETLLRARRRARGARCAPSSTAPWSRAGPRRRRRSPSCAPNTASTSRCPSTPAGSARSPATCSRRLPTAGCALVAVGPHVPQGLLPPADRRLGLAARVLGRDRSRAAAGGAGHRRRRLAADRDRADRRRRRSPRGSGASTSGGWRSTCSTPTARRTTRCNAGSPAACTTATRRRGWRSTRCSGSAGSARCARWDASRRSSTSTRATPRSRRWSSDAASTGHRRRSTSSSSAPVPGRCSRPTRRSRPATTPTARARSRRRSAGSPPSSARRPRELLALGHNARREGDRAPDEGAPFGVTQAALRLSRGAGAVSRRHGEVAREMWRDPMWPDREVAEVPIGHVTNGVHVPTWLGRADARAARRAPRRAAGSSARTTRTSGPRSTRSPTATCGARVGGSGPSSSSSSARAASPTGWGAATCAATSTRPRARSTPRR